MNTTCNKPLASKGFTSYRYSCRYGYIMIGASSNYDALKQAQLSTSDTVVIDKLEIWSSGSYVKVV